MRMTPIPQQAGAHEAEQLLQLGILKHEKYIELYQLIQLQNNTRIRIDQLTNELKLSINSSYNYSPISHLEIIANDLNLIKRKKDSAADSDSKGKRVDPMQPTPSP